MNNGRFVQNPVSLDVKRSRFNRDFNHKTTFNVGELVPFFVDEVLPGDTFDVKTAFVARLSTLKVPVMDNLFIDFAYFFVPNRIVMDDWAKVMGENKTSAWAPTVETFVPTVKYDFKEDSPSNYEGALGSIADYMGVSFLGVTDATQDVANYDINVLPFRAYVTIYNEFYRSENLQDPIYCPTDATDRKIVSGHTAFNKASAHLGYSPLLIANKVPDYFTSCLPEPQKGPSVVIPVGLVAPVKTATENNAGAADFPALKWNQAPNFTRALVATPGIGPDVDKTITRVGTDTVTPEPGLGGIAPSNLVADLTQATATSINELRNAFQLQRLYEKDARGGTRYTELITSHFGVSAPDAQLQRPVFLGGSRKPINISQVLATAQNDTDNTALADTGAFSLTAGMPASFTKSFTEHGFIIGVCTVRYEHVYAKSLERFWFRKRRFDYYDPVFANLGEQPVMSREIDYRTGDNTTVFGYQEAWADYRYKPSRVSAEMKAAVSTGSLYYWHFADETATVPTLSESWLAEDKNNIDRALAVTSKLSRQIIADILVSNNCTRVMPLYSVPGLIDHN